MLEVAEVAELELTEAAEYYESRSPGLGLEFVRHVRIAFERIEAAPFEQPPWTLAGVPPAVRRTHLAKFEHSVVFVTEPRLVAIAVMHQRQRPAYWMSRLSTF